MAVVKPIYLDADGILARLVDGSIINAGGVAGSFFTIGGKGVLLDDGSSSSPGGSALTLQTVYDASPTANIKLATGKDFTITDDTDDGVYFKVDAETGKVTISGDLDVIGDIITVESTIQDSDHWLISPKSGSTVALKIEPDAGVTPLVDLISVRRTFGTTPVFKIDKDGNVLATQNLTISGTISSGLINGVDLVQLNDSVTSHFDGTAQHHTAADVDITEIESIPSATNVQAALENLSDRIDTVISNPANVVGYEHTQNSAALTWTIQHNQNTRRATVVLYDSAWQQIIPDSVTVVDENTVTVSFSSAIVGKAILTLF